MITLRRGGSTCLTVAHRAARRIRSVRRIFVAVTCSSNAASSRKYDGAAWALLKSLGVPLIWIFPYRERKELAAEVRH
jgi:hypothetical protein